MNKRPNVKVLKFNRAILAVTLGGKEEKRLLILEINPVAAKLFHILSRCNGIIVPFVPINVAGTSKRTLHDR